MMTPEQLEGLHDELVEAACVYCGGRGCGRCDDSGRGVTA